MEIQRLRKALAFKSALVIGTFCAVSLVASMVGAALTWKLLRGESLAQLHRSLAGSTSVMSAQVRSELQKMIQELGTLAERRNQRSLAEANAEVSSGSFDADLLDVSFWDPGDQDSGPARKLLLTNSEHLKGSEESVLRSQLQREKVTQWLAQGRMDRGIRLEIDSLPETGQVGLLVVPLGPAETVVSEVAVAHFRLNRIQKLFLQDSSGSFALLNRDQVILAHPDARRVGTLFGRIPEEVRANGLSFGTFEFRDDGGERWKAAYRRISTGKLLLVTSVAASVADGRQLFRAVGHAALFTLFYFLITLAVLLSIFGSKGVTSGQLPFRRFRLDDERQDALSALGLGASDALNEPSLSWDASGPEAPAESAPVPPMREAVFVLAGMIWDEEKLLEKLEPEDAALALNEVLAVAAFQVQAYQGNLELGHGGSFAAYWSDGSQALACALGLRREFVRLNQARKLDGLKPLTLCLGLDAGQGFVAKLGPQGRSRRSLAGDVVGSAQALAGFAVAAGTDFLLSQEVWQLFSDRLQGEQLGEVRLTPLRGLTGYYTVKSYSDADGLPVPTVPSFDPNELSQAPQEVQTLSQLYFPKRQRSRWMVNNGSQIVGPLAAGDIAQRLFAQEFDFDSECWVEGAGFRKQIRSAGVFSGSDDEGAQFWIFDGETIHGPVREGFLRTALMHDAIPETSYLCEKSTINGWRLISDWRKTLITRASPLQQSAEKPASPSEESGQKPPAFRTPDPSRKAA